jgi:hypothetical protein
MRRSLLNYISPLEADIIDTLVSCQAWKRPFDQAGTLQFVAGLKVLS